MEKQEFTSHTETHTPQSEKPPTVKPGKTIGENIKRSWK